MVVLFIVLVVEANSFIENDVDLADYIVQNVVKYKVV